jgi:hypothetical protein
MTFLERGKRYVVRLAIPTVAPKGEWVAGALEQFDEDGLLLSGPAGKSLIPWSAVLLVEEERKME